MFELVAKRLAGGLLAAACLVPLSHPATADDVVAYGYAAEDACVYASDVVVPAGSSVRAEPDCRLVVVEPPPREQVWAPATGADALPKAMSGNPDDTSLPMAAGLPGVDVSVGEPAGVVPGSLVRSRRAVIDQHVHDELGRLMYRDTLLYDFKRQADGRMLAFTFYDGACRTGGSVHDDPLEPADYLAARPYDPSVLYCWGGIDAATATRFTLESGGWYTTRATVPPFAVEKDFRRMFGRFVATQNGFDQELSSCDIGGALPIRWTTTCIIDEFGVDP